MAGTDKPSASEKDRKARQAALMVLTAWQVQRIRRAIEIQLRGSN